jgi:hypothetical protein
MTNENKYISYFPYILLFFFLNNVLLPEGLLYTTLLSPVFLYWLYKNNHLKQLFGYSMLLLVPFVAHLFVGFDIKSYVISSGLVFTAWVFLFTAIHSVPLFNENLNKIFRKVLIFNSILLVVALAFLPLISLQEVFWSSIPISPSVPGFPRLKMLAYEPSHYALLLSPVFLYFILKIIAGKEKHAFLITIAVGLPLVLSLSFGVLGGLAIALLIGLVSFATRLPKTSLKIIFYSVFFIVGIVVILLVIWPENPVVLRLENIFAGKDTSAKGRLVESFMFSWDLARNYDIWFGVGPGQIKILAHDFIINFYKYNEAKTDVVRIPNAIGEMMATYGIYGFVAKITAEIYFFFRLKVYRNLYNLSLFIFIFIYQFSGSFLTNVAEIGVWVIAFQSRFPLFEFKPLKEKAR